MLPRVDINYWLGGKDNLIVDRTVGEQLREAYPAIADLARKDRQFLGRAVRYLAGEAGIRQFLDIGSGLPTVDNTHEVAQWVAPEIRVVYIHSDRCNSGCVHARRAGQRAGVNEPCWMCGNGFAPGELVTAEHTLAGKAGRRSW